MKSAFLTTALRIMHIRMNASNHPEVAIFKKQRRKGERISLLRFMGLDL